MASITAATVTDLRFPTSLRTTRRPTSSPPSTSDSRTAPRRLAGGAPSTTDKGVMHMAVGAVMNAVWDLRSKREGRGGGLLDPAFIQPQPSPSFAARSAQSRRPSTTTGGGSRSPAAHQGRTLRWPRRSRHHPPRWRRRPVRGRPALRLLQRHERRRRPPTARPRVRPPPPRTHGPTRQGHRRPLPAAHPTRRGNRLPARDRSRLRLPDWERLALRNSRTARFVGNGSVV